MIFFIVIVGRDMHLPAPNNPPVAGAGAPNNPPVAGAF